MANELPRSLAQLLADSVISIDDQRMSCSICHSRYLVHPSTENAVELPCKHVFGVECISEWLNRKNSCPICRKPVLHVAQATTRAQDRQARRRRWLQELSHWQPDPQAWQRRLENEGVTDAADQELTYTISFEPIFWDLLEGIVQYIEDPAVLLPRELLRKRLPLHKLLGLGCFSAFAHLIRGPDCELKALAQSLPDILSDPAPYDICMAGLGVATRTRPADVPLIEKIAAWLERIKASRDRLHNQYARSTARRDATARQDSDSDIPAVPRRSSRRARTAVLPATPASASTARLRDAQPPPSPSRPSPHSRSNAPSPGPPGPSQTSEADRMEIDPTG
ncbi:MAG: hypothetical protein Q9174_003542 [Haloplaca sp. 1 TL-2023]